MTRLAHAQVTLTHKALRTIYQDIAQRPSIEACGVLLGTLDEQNNWHIEQAQPLCNIFSSPVYFEFDPEELLMVELAHPEQIIGVYHSHPTGFARASSTDRENMQRVNQQQRIPWIWLIINGPFERVSSLLEEEQDLLSIAPAASFKAYHHYADAGLRDIRVRFDEEV